MPEWECPACTGGFPEPETTTEGTEDGFEVHKTCPWCGEMMDGYPREVTEEQFDQEVDVRRQLQ